MSPTRCHADRRALLAAALGAALPAWGAPLQPGQRVEWPPVTLLDGRSLAPAHWQDRAAVLVFFTTSCPYCARHNPLVQKLHAAAEGKALQVLGASLGEPPATVQAYVRERGLHFPVTPRGQLLRPRFSNRAVIPLTVVVDRQGVLREVIPGEMFEEDVLGLLRYAG